MFELARVVLSGAVLLAASSPHELMEKADRIRTEWEDAVITIRVTASKPSGEARSTRFEVSSKGGDRALIRFLDPEDEGKAVVINGNSTWLVFPKARNPVKVPPSHRVFEGAAVADISRIRFAEDYDAILERRDVLAGVDCDVLRLSAKQRRSPTFPIVRVWIDRKEALYRRAVFLLSSGRTAREVTFDAYRRVEGKTVLGQMTIVDTLRPGSTIVEYLSYERKKLPDEVFTVKAAESGSTRR